jgi:hypothetical protein
MPYFYEKDKNINLLFIHIPKTGGTSLEFYFKNKFNIELNSKSMYMFLDEKIKQENNIDIKSSMQHLTYLEIMEYKNFFNINLENLKIISVVRNPYERLVSDLFFFNKINTETSKESVYEIIKKYLTEFNDNHVKSQYLFITDENKILIQNLILLHTETLTQDMINIGYTDFSEKQNVNKNSCLNYYDFLNNDSIKLINDYYDYDFILFNYNKIIV